MCRSNTWAESAGCSGRSSDRYEKRGTERAARMTLMGSFLSGKIDPRTQTAMSERLAVAYKEKIKCPGPPAQRRFFQRQPLMVLMRYSKMRKITGVAENKMPDPHERYRTVGLVFTCVLVLIFGLLSVGGFLLPPRSAKSIGGLCESIILVTTAIAVLSGRKWAPQCVLLCAIMVTLDGPLYYLLCNLHPPIRKTQDIALFFIRPILYWVAYFWYKRWFCAWRNARSELNARQ
jgi:hypothetical protein